MKIATLYRKDGKVILETDNDAIAQVATDTPQDVVVMAAHYFTGERQVGRPAALAAPYGPDYSDCSFRGTPRQGECASRGCGFCRAAAMAGIDEVRERLASVSAVADARVSAESDDIRAMLDDHARLQADAERLHWLEDFVRHAYAYGVSFDWAKASEGEPGGFRFMTRHRLDARHPTLRAAIDAAKAVQS